MRRRWNRVVGATVIVASLGAGAAAFQIDAEVVTRVVTSPTALWVPSEPTGEIVQVDAVSGEVTGRVAVAERGASLVVEERAGAVTVVDRSAGRASLVDPALFEVVGEVALPVEAPTLIDVGPDSLVLATVDQVGLVDRNLSTATAFGVDHEVVSVAALGEGGVASFSEGTADFGPEGVDALSSSADVFVVRVGEQVVELDSAEARIRGEGDARACVERTLEADAHLVGHARGWVATVESGWVQVIDVEEGWCWALRIGEPGSDLGRPAIAGDTVFVPDRSSEVVHIVEPLADRSSEVPVIGSQDLRVRSRDGHVVAFSAGSRFVSVLDRRGVVHLVDTAAQERDLRAVVAEDAAAAVIGGDDDDEVVDIDGESGDAARRRRAARIDAAVLAATVTNPDEPTPAAADPGPADAESSSDDALTANFAFSAATVAVGEAVRFVDESTGSPDSWVWDFGDGTSAQGRTVEHAWDAPGTYAVTLQVARGDETAENSLTITVLAAETPRPPAADFSFSTSVAGVGDRVFFEDRSTGGVDRWRWDFGDGTTSDDPNPSKEWRSPGFFTVRLTVANGQGSDTASIVVEVVQTLEAPVAVIDMVPERLEVGRPATFEASSSAGPATFLWSFGDGATATGPRVTHVFEAEGAHTVTVVARNEAGLSSASVDVAVDPATIVPVARIAALPTIIEVGDAVTLTSLSGGGPEAEEWAFGDGTTAEGTTVTHTWTAAGTYVVTLTATNRAGSDSTTVTVDVLEELSAPVAAIGEHDPAPWVNEATVFLDDSIDATAWLWDFGDGITSTAQDPVHTFTAGGSTTVTLTVTNRNGSDTASVVVEPRLRPFADFDASPTTVRVGEAVSFTDLSVNAVAWSWDFGDETTSSLQDPTHTYVAVGSYSVRLTVANATGDEHISEPVLIDVDPPPPEIASLGASATDVVVGGSVGFVPVVTGSVSTWAWDFGDGASSAVQSPSHSWSAAGSYDVELTVTGPGGEDTAAVTITVHDPPEIASLGASATEVVVGGSVGFEPVVVGSVSTWAWNFGDGSSSAVQRPSHSWSAAGSYTAMLTVTGTHGGQDTASVTIRVHEASFGWEPGAAALEIDFTDTSSGSPARWAWDFGDNTSSSLQDPSHTYTASGTYTVTLTVTWPFGGQDTASATVTVHDAPEITSLGESVKTVVVDDTVGFEPEVTGSVSTWLWDFGDGSSSAVQRPSHSWSAAGSYTVTLTVTGTHGGQDTASVTIRVHEASFGWEPGAGALEIDFTDTSSDSPTSWAWDFGDPGSVGNESSEQNPSHTYTESGTYTVTLTVTWPFGGQDTASATVTVT